MSNLTANPTTETFICYKGQTSIQDSAYGYYPSLYINGFFLSLFTALFVVNIFLGIKYKTWAFTLGMSFGYVAEMLAYVFRHFLIENPWSTTCVILQTVLFNFGPALLNLGISIISDEAVRTFDPNHSHWYPPYYLFVVVEYFSVVLQAIGVVFAFYENKVSSQLDLGSFLVFFATLGSFATMMVVLAVRHFIILPNKPGSEEETFDERSTSALSSLCDFRSLHTFPVRSHHRHPRHPHALYLPRGLTKGGWGSSLMQNQNAFIACDSMISATAALFLNGFPSGVLLAEDALYGRLLENVSCREIGYERGYWLCCFFG